MSANTLAPSASAHSNANNNNVEPSEMDMQRPWGPSATGRLVTNTAIATTAELSDGAAVSVSSASMRSVSSATSGRDAEGGRGEGCNLVSWRISSPPARRAATEEVYAHASVIPDDPPNDAAGPRDHIEVMPCGLPPLPCDHRQPPPRLGHQRRGDEEGSGGDSGSVEPILADHLPPRPRAASLSSTGPRSAGDVPRRSVAAYRGSIASSSALTFSPPPMHHVGCDTLPYSTETSSVSHTSRTTSPAVGIIPLVGVTDSSPQKTTTGGFDGELTRSGTIFAARLPLGAFRDDATLSGSLTLSHTNKSLLFSVTNGSMLSATVLNSSSSVLTGHGSGDNGVVPEENEHRGWWMGHPTVTPPSDGGTVEAAATAADSNPSLAAAACSASGGLSERREESPGAAIGSPVKKDASRRDSLARSEYRREFRRRLAAPSSGDALDTERRNSRSHGPLSVLPQRTSIGISTPSPPQIDSDDGRAAHPGLGSAPGTGRAAPLLTASTGTGSTGTAAAPDPDDPWAHRASSVSQAVSSVAGSNSPLRRPLPLCRSPTFEPHPGVAPHGLHPNSNGASCTEPPGGDRKSNAGLGPVTPLTAAPGPPRSHAGVGESSAAARDGATVADSLLMPATFATSDSAKAAVDSSLGASLSQGLGPSPPGSLSRLLCDESGPLPPQEAWEAVPQPPGAPGVAEALEKLQRELEAERILQRGYRRKYKHLEKELREEREKNQVLTARLEQLEDLLSFAIPAGDCESWLHAGQRGREEYADGTVRAADAKAVEELRERLPNVTSLAGVARVTPVTRSVETGACTRRAAQGSSGGAAAAPAPSSPLEPAVPPPALDQDGEKQRVPPPPRRPVPGPLSAALSDVSPSLTGSREDSSSPVTEPPKVKSPGCLPTTATTSGTAIRATSGTAAVLAPASTPPPSPRSGVDRPSLPALSTAVNAASVGASVGASESGIVPVPRAARDVVNHMGSGVDKLATHEDPAVPATEIGADDREKLRLWRIEARNKRWSSSSCASPPPTLVADVEAMPPPVSSVTLQPGPSSCAAKVVPVAPPTPAVHAMHSTTLF